MALPVTTSGSTLVPLPGGESFLIPREAIGDRRSMIAQALTNLSMIDVQTAPEGIVCTFRSPTDATQENIARLLGAVSNARTPSDAARLGRYSRARTRQR